MKFTLCNLALSYAFTCFHSFSQSIHIDKGVKDILKDIITSLFERCERYDYKLILTIMFLCIECSIFSK